MTLYKIAKPKAKVHVQIQCQRVSEREYLRY